MGKMNLLKAKYDGKVGQTVGAKWKDKATIRTYSKPANPRTTEQVKVRDAFSEMTKFVALFADSIKYRTALNVAGMSVRNAIIKLNKSMIDSGVVSVKDLQISKGGLQKPSTFAASKGADNLIEATWVKPTATNFSAKAKMIIVAVDAELQIVDVFEAAADAESVKGSVSFENATGIQVFGYYLDYRGTSKVASISVSTEIA